MVRENYVVFKERTVSNFVIFASSMGVWSVCVITTIGRGNFSIGLVGLYKKRGKIAIY